MQNKKSCQNCTRDFLIKPDDFAFYERMAVPPPTWCPECRFQGRLIFRNERIFYKRPCSSCKKDVISMYHADAPFPVYCRSCWWSDDWDARDFSMSYDPSRSFMEQFVELRNKVPHEALQSNNSVKSDYANFIRNAKEAYLSSIVAESENVSFSRNTIQCKDCVSCMYVTKCNSCVRLDRSAFCTDCSDGSVLENCRDTHFTSHSIGCSSCYGCINLRHQQYCIYNQQYSKEEYQKKVAELMQLPYAEQQKNVREFHLTQPHRANMHFESDNVSGEDIYYSVNCKQCFMANFVRDSAFCQDVTSWSRSNETVQDLYDCTVVADMQHSYQVIGGSKSYNCRFGIINDNCVGSEYSMFCYGCEDLFGCLGLRKKKRCILNKEYTKEEFTRLRADIVAGMREYGEFFPKEASPFGYNETMAQDHFASKKAEAIHKGYRWRDQEQRYYEIKDDIVACEHGGTCDDHCSTAFKFTPFELQLYRRLNLHQPQLCPNCRYLDSLKQRNPFKLWKRNCMKCDKPIETSYAPDRLEIIYCEDCYKNEVA